MMRRLLMIVLGLLVLGAPSFARALPTDPVYRFAWSEGAGWLYWGGVDIPDEPGGQLNGYVWGENIGWISLNCSNTSSCGSVDYKVSRDASGDFSGYAWGENVGWISFSCSTTSSCGSVDYGVSVAAGGELIGFAWGENIGWISLNCSNTSSCGTGDYKVALDLPVAPGGGGLVFSPMPTPGGGGALETATPSPSLEPSPGGTPLPSGLPLPSGTPPPGAVPGPDTVPPSGGAPPAPPPASAPPVSSGSFLDTIDTVGGFLDGIAEWIFEGGVRSLGGVQRCEGVLGISACALTAFGVAATGVALFAAVVQKELWAATLWMLRAVGLKRDERRWGVVYDVTTKYPIAAAKIELLDARGQVLETRYSDRDGRYGFATMPSLFNLPSLEVSLRASKPGYAFPASLNTSGADYVVYEHPYQGEKFTLTGDAEVSFSVPMHALDGARTRLSGLGVRFIGPGADKFLSGAFVVGVVVVPLYYWLFPTPFNLLLLTAFIAANLVRILIHRPQGFTKDAITGAVMPFALVTLLDESGVRVGFAVSDEYGRYALSVLPDRSYDLVAYTPAQTVPARTVKKRIIATSRAGRLAWVTTTLPL